MEENDIYSKMIKGKDKDSSLNIEIKGVRNLDKKDFLIELTKNNYISLNRELEKDDNYTRYFRKKIFKYWRCKCNLKYNKQGLLDIIIMIDFEYSTNTWRYPEKRPDVHSIINYITDRGNRFWKRLKNGDTTLPNDLRKSCNKGDKGPRNLASKICYCFSVLFYKRDNYYINDSVVRSVLPYYLEYYQIPKAKYEGIKISDTGYEDLHKLMDLLKEEVGLTRHEIDLIMWYSYRNEKIASISKVLPKRRNNNKKTSK